VIVEAWGPSRSACLEESVLGLVSTFAEIPDRPGSDRAVVHLSAGDDEELLVSLLDEVIYLLDASAVVPIAVALEERDDGVIAGWFDTAPGAELEVVGAIPKGISRSGLVIEEHDGQWSSHVEVDV
jgi:SHS2 domain-containing protein